MTWGPTLAADGTNFRFWAPDRDAVTLEVAEDDAVVMTREPEGWFSAKASVGPGTRYRFRLTDDLAVPDPASRAQSGGVHGWSVVVGPEAYTWRTPDWRGRPWEEMVIQEVHVGTLGGFADVADHSCPSTRSAAPATGAMTACCPTPRPKATAPPTN
jgi:maltooligosyltrehalose trehalohydrolase